MTDTFSDAMWETASTDAHVTAHTQRVAHAKVAASAVWPFLAEAGTPAEFDSRLALSADSLDRLIAEALADESEQIAPVRDEVLAGLRADFDLHLRSKTAMYPEPDTDLSGGWARERDRGGPEYWGAYMHGTTGQVIHLYRGSRNLCRFYDEGGQQVGPEQGNVAPAVAWAQSNGYFNPDLSGLGPIGGSHQASAVTDLWGGEVADRDLICTGCLTTFRTGEFGYDGHRLEPGERCAKCGGGTLESRIGSLASITAGEVERAERILMLAGATPEAGDWVHTPDGPGTVVQVLTDSTDYTFTPGGGGSRQTGTGYVVLLRSGQTKTYRDSEEAASLQVAARRAIAGTGSCQAHGCSCSAFAKGNEADKYGYTNCAECSHSENSHAKEGGEAKTSATGNHRTAEQWQPEVRQEDGTWVPVGESTPNKTHAFAQVENHSTGGGSTRVVRVASGWSQSPTMPGDQVNTDHYPVLAIVGQDWDDPHRWLWSLHNARTGEAYPVSGAAESEEQAKADALDRAKGHVQGARTAADAKWDVGDPVTHRYQPGDKVIRRNWNGAEAPGVVVADPAEGMPNDAFVDIESEGGIYPSNRRELRPVEGARSVACRKCTAGRDPSGGRCDYCDGQGALDATTAMLKAADGWDQGITREAFARTARMTNCTRCGAYVNLDFGADSPADHADAAGTQDDPRSPGDHDDLCDVCEYGPGGRLGGLRQAFRRTAGISPEECMDTDEHGRQMRDYGSCNVCGMGMGESFTAEAFRTDAAVEWGDPGDDTACPSCGHPQAHHESAGDGKTRCTDCEDYCDEGKSENTRQAFRHEAAGPWRVLKNDKPIAEGFTTKEDAEAYGKNLPGVTVDDQGKQSQSSRVANWTADEQAGFDRVRKSEDAQSLTQMIEQNARMRGRLPADDPSQRLLDEQDHIAYERLRALQSSRVAVDESGYGADRYQRTPAPAKPSWIHDAWDQDANPEDGSQGSDTTANPVVGQPDRPAGQRAIERSKAEMGNDEDVREAARRMLGAVYPAPPSGGRWSPEVDQNSQRDRDAPTTQPVTTKPRVMPTRRTTEQPSLAPGDEPDLTVAPQKTTPGEPTSPGVTPTRAARQRYTAPTVEQRVQAKVARMVESIRQANPGLSVDQAREMAIQTVATYPKMVRSASEPDNDRRGAARR